MPKGNQASPAAPVGRGHPFTANIKDFVMSAVDASFVTFRTMPAMLITPAQALFYGNPRQLRARFPAAAGTWAFACPAGRVLLALTNRLAGPRAATEFGMAGPDIRGRNERACRL